MSKDLLGILGRPSGIVHHKFHQFNIPTLLSFIFMVLYSSSSARTLTNPGRYFMKVHQNLKYVNNVSEGKHQKVIPSRLRCIYLAQCICLVLHFWHNWCNCSVGLSRRVCSIQQQTCHLLYTSPNSKTWARGMIWQRESNTHFLPLLTAVHACLRCLCPKTVGQYPLPPR